MIRDIKLPEISESITTAEVINILVSEEEEVQKEQDLIELESQKAIFALPAPEAGVIKEILVNKDDEVTVGQALVRMETREGPPVEEKTKEPDRSNEEKREKEEKSEKESESEKEPESEKESEPEEQTSKKPARQDEHVPTEEKKDDAETSEPGKQAQPEAPESEKQEDAASSAESGAHMEKVPAAPSVRRFARETGADLRKVQGSGPAGRISRDDVKQYVKQTGAGRTAAPALPDFEIWGPVERRSMSKVRQITADSTAASWRAIPHVTQFEEADITELEAFRKQQNRTKGDDAKLTVTAILVKVCAEALKRFPRFNASLDIENKAWIHKNYIHIGVAVDTERGLLVPVIRNADQKNLTDLAAELIDLAGSARNKTIKPDQMEGQNFTISNLGGIGGTAFTPLVYSPQTAILGVARSGMKQQWDGGTFRPRLMLPLSLSYDHRLIDGADGTRFMVWIKDALENPWQML